MKSEYDRLLDVVGQVRKITDFVPEVAIVCGSGLGALAGCMQKVAEVDVGHIKGYPQSTVSGHSGRLFFGYLGGKRAVLQQGRVHLDEGYTPQQAVLPVRVMKILGAETLIVSNAAGGINPNFKVGDFMLISDQISQFVPSPLAGKNVEQLGVRFPDMTGAYDAVLREKCKDVAAKSGISVHEGVYVQLSGPNYETPAEIRMLATLGADAVGMSTAIETIAARHAGMRVLGVSLISNMAAGITGKPLSHDEVKSAAAVAARDFATLITETLKVI